jgi:hypothetical protein
MQLQFKVLQVLAGARSRALSAAVALQRCKY